MVKKKKKAALQAFRPLLLLLLLVGGRRAKKKRRGDDATNTNPSRCCCLFDSSSRACRSEAPTTTTSFCCCVVGGPQTSAARFNIIMMHRVRGRRARISIGDKSKEYYDGAVVVKSESSAACVMRQARTDAECETLRATGRRRLPQVRISFEPSDIILPSHPRCLAVQLRRAGQGSRHNKAGRYGGTRQSSCH